MKESEIEAVLQGLSFTKNDSKVLLTLCKYKVLSPADIAKHSGVDRARVYDSLNRLIERGFIQKEPVKRGANYQVIPIEKIFKSIRHEYKEKITETIMIEEAISELEVDSEEYEPRVWSINSKDKIRNKIKELINAAEERIFFIITPDLLMEELGGYEWIMKELWNKKFSNPKVNIVIALKFFDDIVDEVKKLLKLNVVVHSIEGDTVIPFGLLIVDDGFLLTTLDQVKEAPEYTSGLWLENGRRRQIIGYEHLFRHFISSECKEATLIPKNAPYSEA
ncbi:MAG: winged helix-turn-helix transcriptional regulator [Promethearchaeota archaeon]|nr:MAG: winged helix-turn-helix transcriptional regulator [Candidatus Lokiarchaeota archaeon]